MRKPAPNTPRSLHGSSALIFLLRLLPSLAQLFVMLYFGRTLSIGLASQYQAFWVRLLVITTFTCAGLHAFAFSFTAGQLTGLLRGLRNHDWIVYGAWIVAGGIVFALLPGNAYPAALLIAVVLVFTASPLAETYLTIQQQYSLLVAVNGLYAAAFIAVHIWWAGHSRSLYLLFGLLLLLGLIRLIIFVAAGRRQLRSTASEAVSLPHSRSIRSVWMHLGLYDIAQQLFRYTDKVAALLLLGEAVYGVYQIGSTEVPFIPVLLGAVGSAGLLQMSRGGRAGEPVFVARQSAMLLASVVFPLFLTIYLFRYTILLSLLPKYGASLPILSISLLTLPLRAYSFTGLLQHYGKVRTINLGAVLDVVLALLLMYPFYKLWGAPGLALAVACSTWAQAVFYLLAGARAARTSPLKLLPLRNWLIKAIVFSAAVIALKYATARLADARILLLLAGGLMALLTAIALLADIRSIRRHGSDTAPGTAQQH